MSAAKHTPGPWEVCDALKDREVDIRPVFRGHGQTPSQSFYAYRPIATVKHDKRLSGAEAEANARLIAAAPEMAALLPRLREIVAEEADDTLSLFEGSPKQSEMVAPYDALLREIDAVMAKITGSAA